MTAKLGLIGAGMINTQIAHLATRVGINVMLSNTRGPESLQDLVDELGPHAQAGTIADAAAFSDLVSVSIPFGAYASLPADALARKIVIDTMNYYPGRDGDFPEVAERTITTSELLQQHLPDANVVKALHNLDALHLLNGARPDNRQNRWALPVAGDDQTAKNRVIELLDQIGYDGVDCGTLADSWRIEADTPIYVNPYVGPTPDGLTLDEQIDWYATDTAAVVTRADVERMAAEATRKAPAGGRPTSLHRAWTGYLARLHS
ncbi:NADPH-dependent F420 reductase [Rhodococcus sp. ACT016]|uniref:NADPH-dependent F420 reductase n=1 Tax=Rhodococcus sp. ACT016 TaxID=3134808 RepID=UPI003D27D32F